MPVISIENRAGLSASSKAELARKITEVVGKVIKSPDDLISVIFHDHPAENTYRSGEPTEEAIIFCHIRKGRSDEAILNLMREISTVWTSVTQVSEDNIELAVQEYPAKFTFRGGDRLPEPPFA
jgi:phenylpyruvate tautomerase PptA (4-oxalocrotonate tautomerase family)